jgi:hypothetical protein
MAVNDEDLVEKHQEMSEIMRLLLNEKKSRPWDTKLGNERIRRVYTIEMDKDGRYEVIETLPNVEMHHSNFANEGDAEAWATYRRDSAAFQRKRRWTT